MKMETDMQKLGKVWKSEKKLVVLVCKKNGGISMQMVVVLISARILKMVLDQWELLSLGIQWKEPVNTYVKTAVYWWE